MANVVLVVLGFALGVVSTLIHPSHEPTRNSVDDDLYYQQFDVAIINHDTNTCSLDSNSPMGAEVIKIEYLGEATTDIVGSWHQDSNTIFLYDEGLTVDTMAHEVSHAVETLLVRHHITNTHVRAGMQGYLTDCVWQIVREDY